MLPTDPRLTSLTDEQVELLFLTACRVMSDSELKETYWERKTREKSSEELPVNELENMGYSPEMIETIKKGILDGRAS